MFPKSFFIANRHNLFQKFPEKAICILTANKVYPQKGDQYFCYRQDSNFFYLTGLNIPNVGLVLAKNGNGQCTETLFIPKPDAKKETWEGAMATKEEVSEISGIGHVFYIDGWENFLSDMLAGEQTIYLDIEEKEKPFFEYKNLFYKELQRKYPNHTYHNAGPLIAALRLIKGELEMEAIRRAVSITREAFVEGLSMLRPDLYEYHMAAGLGYLFRIKGAQGSAFHTIAASGANACVLHYIKNDALLKTGDLLLMDFGAEYNMYAADCSRTLPINGRFSSRQKEVYDKMLNVFYEARMLITPGTTIGQINEKVEGLCRQVHLELGLYTEADVKANKDITKKYYPHGNSHFLGLDVHDVGDKATELLPGMVLTCEPGIYIKEESLGIRIENDILVTPQGNEDLMARLPLETDALEALMKKR
jgi:Xaa-Pro aminopeptidase